MKKFFLLLFLFVWFLATLDGVLDLSSTTGMWLLNRAQASVFHAFPTKPKVAAYLYYPGEHPTVMIPGAGEMYRSIRSPRLNIDANGMRLNGRPPPAHPAATGMMLGASQAFGYLAADDQTISAVTEKALGNVRVKNYASSGQRLTHTGFRWRQLDLAGEKYDFVIVAGTEVDLVRDCMQPRTEKKKNDLQKLYDRTRQTLKHDNPYTACIRPEGRELAIEHSLASLGELVRMGRRRGARFVVVMLPTPFDAGAVPERLKRDVGYSYYSSYLAPTFRTYRQRVRQLKIPEIVDLTDIPGIRSHFVDLEGHFTPEGYRRVALALIDRLGPDFFAKASAGP